MNIFQTTEDRTVEMYHCLSKRSLEFKLLYHSAKQGELETLKKEGVRVIESAQKHIEIIDLDYHYFPDTQTIQDDLKTIAFAASLEKLKTCEAKPHYSRFVEGLIYGDYDQMRTAFGILHHILQWDTFELEHDGRDRLLNITGEYALGQARRSNAGNTTAFGRDNYCRIAMNAAEYCGARCPVDEINEIFTDKS